MGIFRRRVPVRDHSLPLDEDQAQRLRRLVRTAFAESGREVIVHADHVVDDSGARFGLWNLATLCAAQRPRQWPETVRRHVTAMSQPDVDLATMSDEQLRRSVVARLVDASGLTDPGWHGRLPAISEDLVQVLCIDLPDRVVTPRPDDLAGRGDLDLWYATGRGNLRRLLATEDLDHELVPGPDARGAFHVVTGRCLFTASFALILPDVLALMQTPDAGHGMLVAVPFRHQLLYRAVDGPDSAAALQNMFAASMQMLHSSPGPVSPHVYWVRDQRWTQVTRIVDGGAEVHCDPELGHLLFGTEDPQVD